MPPLHRATSKNEGSGSQDRDRDGDLERPGGVLEFTERVGSSKMEGGSGMGVGVRTQSRLVDQRAKRGQ